MAANNFKIKLLSTLALIKYMLFGAGIAIAVILVFLLPAGKSDPQWGTLWIVKPLVLSPLAGAAGGAFFYILRQLFTQGKGRIVATVFGVIMYIFILWIGIIVGLNGTHWN